MSAACTENDEPENEEPNHAELRLLVAAACMKEEGRGGVAAAAERTAEAICGSSTDDEVGSSGRNGGRSPK